MEFELNGKRVGDGSPAYIVFEAGPTHTGLNSAKALAKVAKESGADAVKFQITDHKKLIQDRSLKFTYSVINKEGEVREISEPLFDIWERRYMPRKDWEELKNYCDELGISFFATVFSEDDIDFVTSLNVQSLKIASQDMNYKQLIQYAASTGLPIQIDTGSSSLAEIETAFHWIQAESNNNIIINHCPSGYPARLSSIDLRMIVSLKKLFQVPVAFSDHNPGRDMDIAALVLGANIIEKTITLSRQQESCEHMFSLEPNECGDFVNSLRNVELALGTARRVLSEEQLAKRRAVRRGAFLAKDVAQGEKLSIDSINFMRPGFGVNLDDFESFIGRTFIRDHSSGEKIEHSMFGD